MQRVIFLVDMNAFYITCEMVRLPELWNRPAAVAGDPAKRTGIILAANYPARACSVKTAMTVYEALKRCPDLVIVPPDHAYYNEKSQEVMKFLSHFTPVMEQNSIDEAWLDMTGTSALFGDPVTTANRMMTDLKENLSLWCSIGISENKFLSKMAADMKKPLGVTTLWQREVEEKLWPLSVARMWGIGDKTTEKLQQVGVSTIGQLAKADTQFLKRTLGGHMVVLQQKALGHDTSHIIPSQEEDVKSISRSTTLAKDASRPEDIYHELMSLSEDVARRARQYNKQGGTVFVQLKDSHFITITRQVTLPLPTCYTQDIMNAGYSLIKDHWPQETGVRLVGIGLRNFETPEAHQISIFEALGSPNPIWNSQQESQKKIDTVMDYIRQKHGPGKISRASLLKKKTSPTKG